MKRFETPGFYLPSFANKMSKNEILYLTIYCSHFKTQMFHCFGESNTLLDLLMDLFDILEDLWFPEKAKGSSKLHGKRAVC
jgi:hypothetical protein